MVDEIFVVYDGNDDYALKAFFSQDRADEFVKEHNTTFYNELAVWRVPLG